MEELVPALHQWFCGVRQHVFFQTLAQSAPAICWGKAQDQRTEISSELRCLRRHRKGTRQAPGARVGQLLRSVFFKLLQKAAEIAAKRKKEDRMQKLNY